MFTVNASLFSSKINSSFFSSSPILCYIPGIRPGERSAEYIETILIRLMTIGSLYLTFVCLLPEFLISKYPIPFYLGGTSILIVVVVAMDKIGRAHV